MIAADPIVAGEAEGEVLRLERPISLWGGVDPKTGAITDPRHPQFGESLAGRVVVLERLVGSSSSSSILLEAVAAGVAPAALVLGEVDAITALGAIVADELGLKAPPILRLPASAFDSLPARVRVCLNGEIRAG